MIVCPYCQDSEGQVKAGKNAHGQRYKCSVCQRRYTPEPRPRGRPEELRQRAVQMAAQGRKYREIARELHVNAQSVANWVRQQAEPGVIAATESRSTEQEAAAPAAKKRSTIGDVARTAGVSTSTVSNYLNNKGRMSEETRFRIETAIDKLHFTPSALVRAIRRRRTHILGLLIFGMPVLDSRVGMALTPPLLAGIYQAAEVAQQDILVYTGWPDRPERNSGMDFLNGHIDGLLWVVPESGTPAMERIAAAGLPMVALLTRDVPEGVGFVNADNITATYALVMHLAQKGRSRIAFLGPTHQSNFQDRLEGYRQGMAAVGLPRIPALEVTTERWSPLIDYIRTVDSWLALPAPPDAIVVADDGLADTVAQEIFRRGLSVPEDIAVTGFNDVPDAQRICGGLTTIRQPFRQIGQVAVERLLALIEGAPVTECRVTVPTKLIVRASTAPDYDNPGSAEAL